MSWLRIKTVVRRHWYVLWRSPNRWFDIAVWPVFDVLLFGSLGAFVAQENTASRAAAPYLLAGIMLFHVLFQCQIAVTTGFMEETWSRNLLNIMTTPITEIEYAAGLALYAGMKLVMAMVTISVVALVTYQFHLDSIGWGLVPIIGILLIVGWAISLFVIGLILRFGQSAEILAWGINFVMLALSGVFNPVTALPGAVQPIAKLFPTTYAFRAMRTLLDGGGIPWSDVVWGYVGAFVFCALGYWFIVNMLNTFRARGYVTRFS
ncbi:MAG: type transport system permease protein [Acidimicrobiaceae bacterium]|jgi:ABC-2 type transport system permease protein